MRILHTSDWHIGHRLYEQPRIEEHRQFFDWLLTTLQENRVDVLLVSGDIFDTALPSSEATDLYYRFLFRLYSETRAHAVITAGNHDSATHLAAPEEFLKMGRIHVIGKIDSALDIVMLQNGKSAVAIAAVPYLSENEILPHISLETQIEKTERYRAMIKQLYQQCVDKMPKEIPKILMGHLVIHGGEESGSERIIQIGGATAVRVGDLPDRIDYMALGHLHRPQSICGASYPIQYAGSPLPMTFKEALYDKKVYLIDLAKPGGSRLTEFTIPVFKELCRVRGNYDQVLLQANAVDNDWTGKYIEVQLIGQQIGNRDKIRDAFSNRGGQVLLIRTPEVQPHEPNLSIEELSETSPEDVFAEFYQAEHGVEAPNEIRTTFIDLIQMLPNETNTEKS
ncbi:exonuclease subunit SbcD [Candidatus Poribacteria bacterium]|nr:exonuclease subunit SbcD [Candidatus Poribacteria bacterium]